MTLKVQWSKPSETLEDKQTKFELDAFSYSEDVELVAQKWGDVVVPADATDEPRGGINNRLQPCNFALRQSSKYGIAIVQM